MEEFGQRIRREHGEHSPYGIRRSQFFSDQPLFNPGLGLQGAEKESRTHSPLAPLENLHVASFWSVVFECIQSCLDLPNLVQVSNPKALNISGPPFQQLALAPTHCHGPWSQLGIRLRLMQRQTDLPSPVTEMKEKSDWWIGAEAPATWCNNFSASSRASLAAARFSAGVRVSATLFACQIE